MSKEDIDQDISMDLSDSKLYFIYNEYNLLLNGFFYYQDQQIEIRIICLKIVIGTFAILGGLMYHHMGLTNNASLLIFSLLPILSLFPVTNLLFKDLVYREGLKMGFFKEAIQLEKSHSWIPSFHRCLVTEGDIHHRPGARQAGLYFWSGAILLFFSALGFSFLPQFSSITARIIVFAIAIVVFLLYWKLIQERLKHTNAELHFEKEEKDFYKKNEDPKKILFISLLHKTGREYIEHFSSIKMRYKKLVIVVITAALIFLSYISDLKGEVVHINQFYLIAFITILSLLGINLIRYLDLNVTHHQIKLLFNLMIRVETDHPSLSKPYVKIKDILYTKKSDPAIFDFLYYGSINTALILLGMTILGLNIKDHYPSKDIIICFAVLAIFFLWEIVSLGMLYKKKNSLLKQKQ